MNEHRLAVIYCPYCHTPVCYNEIIENIYCPNCKVWFRRRDILLENRKRQEQNKTTTVFEVEGWLAWNKRHTSILVWASSTVGRPMLLGFCRPTTLRKLLDGGVNACPIKVPPK
jgi:uncharacterized protein YbaR (Trm112 family)